ncbi:PP0621 family protein [Advenella sp. RU8]|uniref:PP0621 family protein n=1 Tax=Advenella sp. RU8 TaxID=3399575 RepID=UPI003AAB7E44
MRFFLFIVLIIILMLAIRMFAGRIQAIFKNRQSPSHQPPATRQNQASESMVQCAHCHIHLPRSEALLKDGKTWCSEEHARLGQK